MTSHGRILFLALGMLPFAAAHADPDSPEKQACKQEEQQKGSGPVASSVTCAIKTVFQSRIRRRKGTEPVEMTVGSPPMVSDDTDTPGPNNWEVNLTFTGDLAGSERHFETPLLDLNYGVGDRVQLKYEVPYVFDRRAEPDIGGGSSIVSAHGWGDSNVGVKWRFYDNTDTGLSFAVYPQIEFRTPWGSKAVSEGETTFILPLMMTREFEHASITADAGVETHPGGGHSYFASFGVGKRLTDTVALLAEVAGNNLNVSSEEHVLINLGFRAKISETQSITGSLGHDVYAGGDQIRHTYFTLSFQKQFGK
jgi:hypothetical protein